MKAILDFILSNQEMIVEVFALIAGALIALGAAIEGLVRLFPTKDPDSFLERLGKFMIKAGGFVRRLLDRAKVPNKVKHDEP
jgi:hypothetical protein